MSSKTTKAGRRASREAYVLGQNEIRRETRAWQRALRAGAVTVTSQIGDVYVLWRRRAM